MRECDKMERKIRKRTIHVPREGNYICGKCGVKGDCDDSKEDAKKNNEAFYWDENAGEHGKITCLKCNHWLETKEELEEPLEIVEIQQYGFWIRMAKENFIPCKECQDKLDKLLSTSELCIGNKDTEPPIELWRKWESLEEPDEKTKQRIKDWKED
jgi:hypothetical protein